MSSLLYLYCIIDAISKKEKNVNVDLVLLQAKIEKDIFLNILSVRFETFFSDGTFPRQAERDGGLSVDGFRSQCLCRPESSGLYVQSVWGRESLGYDILWSLYRVL